MERDGSLVAAAEACRLVLTVKPPSKEVVDSLPTSREEADRAGLPVRPYEHEYPNRNVVGMRSAATQLAELLQGAAETDPCPVVDAANDLLATIHAPVNAGVGGDNQTGQQSLVKTRETDENQPDEADNVLFSVETAAGVPEDAAPVLKVAAAGEEGADLDEAEVVLPSVEVAQEASSASSSSTPARNRLRLARKYVAYPPSTGKRERDGPKYNDEEDRPVVELKRWKEKIFSHTVDAIGKRKPATDDAASANGEREAKRFQEEQGSVSSEG